MPRGVNLYKVMMKKEISDLIRSRKFSEESIKHFESDALLADIPLLKERVGEYYFQWGCFLIEQNGYNYKNESVLQDSNYRFAKAVKYCPDNADAHNNLGYGLYALAMLKSREEALELLTLANKHLDMATILKPENELAYYNWTNSLIYRADLHTGEEAIGFMQQALEKIKLAAEINPVFSDAFVLWANCYKILAELLPDNADEYLILASEKMEQAIKPGY